MSPFPIAIDPPVLLAPMAAVTDLPFRTVCEEFGVGLTITEFLSAHALTKGDRKTTGKLTASLGGRPFGVQIFGREEEPMQRAAEMAVEIGASLVDINMGCPAKRVVAGDCGSALMREPKVAQSLVRAVVAAVPAHVPVTVKHRAGWSQDERNAPEFACAMVDAGARMITVHGRTRSQGFSGASDLGIIAAVRAAVPSEIPVVGNGDVVDVEGYLAMRRATGCDAVMIGRGAMGNPWLFARIRAVCAGQVDPGPPTLEERLTTFRRHVGLILQLKGGPRTLHEVRKACGWYARGLYGCNALRIEVWAATTAQAAIEQVERFFVERLANAPRQRRGARDVAPLADPEPGTGSPAEESIGLEDSGSGEDDAGRAGDLAKRGNPGHDIGDAA
ncbi:MAG TPA: tRNA dihydrouridine synthase DusB [Kofleriaceae bacterium]|nr:tRNA dihydrouridine synthase DusB [Kofleriaceae bacterium]